MSFWMIEEAVGGPYYIVHSGIFISKKSAEKSFPKGAKCHAVEYVAGQNYGKGPERA